MRYTIPTSSRPIIIDEPDPPALADPEGMALVQAIHDRKKRGSTDETAEASSVEVAGGLA
ncbi:hypothetical protein [Pseudarthrobacter sp. CCNWLW207]|uniref:hypothetical protein n=1 Tax=Pseudarthrobacter sp. CCNWLW207 TaxID=3127468 RepID=UPI0030780380